ncbi:MAG: hypothetical protein ABI565_14200, partial [Vicinamibacteria bacterium]
RLFAGLPGAPRPPLGGEVWGDTNVTVPLPNGSRLKDQLSGDTLTVAHGRIEVAAAFSRFPAAVLSPIP